MSKRSDKEAVKALNLEIVVGLGFSGDQVAVRLRSEDLEARKQIEAACEGPVDIRVIGAVRTRIK